MLKGQTEDRRIRENYYKSLDAYYKGQNTLGEHRLELDRARAVTETLLRRAQAANDYASAAKHSAELRKLQIAERVADLVISAGISDPSQLNATARYYLGIPFSEADTTVMQGTIPGEDTPFTRAIKTSDLINAPAIGVTPRAQTQINMPPGQKAKEVKLGQREAELESGKVYDEAVKNIMEKLKGTLAGTVAKEKLPKDSIAREMVRIYRNSNVDKYKTAKAQISPDGTRMRIINDKGEVLYSD